MVPGAGHRLGVVRCPMPSISQQRSAKREKRQKAALKKVVINIIGNMIFLFNNYHCVLNYYL
jgi:hypothetical protein